jgi:NAD(P)H dehydrogenase (quinone)
LKNVLILYYSVHGSTHALARHIAKGVEAEGVEAKLRTVPRVSAEFNEDASSIAPTGSPYATLDELKQCDGLILGSPTRFGNMAAPVKYFLDSSSELWLAGALDGKPASVFTSSKSFHGGQETTLVSMMLPLLHHGMIISGLPYSLPELHDTQSGGGPYGVSHVSINSELTEHEKKLAVAQGKRMAYLVKKLQ